MRTLSVSAAMKTARRKYAPKVNDLKILKREYKEDLIRETEGLGFLYGYRWPENGIVFPLKYPLYLGIGMIILGIFIFWGCSIFIQDPGLGP